MARTKKKQNIHGLLAIQQPAEKKKEKATTTKIFLARFFNGYDDNDDDDDHHHLFMVVVVVICLHVHFFLASIRYWVFLVVDQNPEEKPLLYFFHPCLICIYKCFNGLMTLKKNKPNQRTN